MAMNQPTQVLAPNKQLGPVLALQALLTEHPELPPLSWTVDPHGTLTGYGHDYHGIDVRQALAAYADLLGGWPTAPNQYPCNDELMVFQHLDTVWQDVRVHITTYASIAAYPELLVPLAVAA
jgi:hypothetical protein